MPKLKQSKFGHAFDTCATSMNKLYHLSQQLHELKEQLSDKVGVDMNAILAAQVGIALSQQELTKFDKDSKDYSDVKKELTDDNDRLDDFIDALPWECQDKVRAATQEFAQQAVQSQNYIADLNQQAATDKEHEIVYSFSNNLNLMVPSWSLDGYEQEKEDQIQAEIDDYHDEQAARDADDSED